MSNKFTVRTSDNDGLFIRSAYEAFRAASLEQGTQPPSMNEFLCGLIVQELHRAYNGGSEIE